MMNHETHLSLAYVIFWLEFFFFFFFFFSHIFGALDKFRPLFSFGRANLHYTRAAGRPHSTCLSVSGKKGSSFRTVRESVCIIDWGKGEEAVASVTAKG
ncbi:hypothetical protein B0H63DRAFT_42785 [Podospora didyma]|uniref:Uncharacterized protein n=1 Tax=Podospora didyma TaxID=330526 RepID=A0AAE0P6P7_9PEZI|nr:hypothetical protein B0H63DRAFT_42785 [Podospora didyma]